MNISRIVSRRIFTFATFAQLILIAFVSIVAISAQTSSVDPSFFPLVSAASGSLGNFTVQPDGKILTYGGFQLVNGVVKNNLVRLNPNGTIDNSFNCTACDFSIINAVVQPDGKIIVSGSGGSKTPNASSARLKRLNSDGSLDTSFAPFGNVPLSKQIFIADVRAIQPDGKLLVIFIGSISNNISYDLNRFNPNGTFDETFTPANVGGDRPVRTTPSKVAVLSNGKILVSINTSGNLSTGMLKRFNANGTPDNTFESPTFSGTAGIFGNGSYISEFAVLADGSVVVVGDFNTVNGISRPNIVKLTPAGGVDLNFVTRNIFRYGEPVYQIRTYQNGKILISTRPVTSSTNRFIRLNAGGSLDNSFIPPANPMLIYNFSIDEADNVFFFANFTEGSVITGKYGRIDENGNLVFSFTVDYARGAFVSALAIQPDKKIIVAGNFERVGQVSRQSLARLNSDGTLDQTFNPIAGFDAIVAKIIVQPDGKILVGGSSPIFDGTDFDALVRLNADGSLDTSFDAKINSVIYSMTLQPDGKILIGGIDIDIAGQQRTGIARLNPDGSLDTAFNPALLDNNPNPSQYVTPTIRGIIAQPDGKIVIGGTFKIVNGVNRTNLARLNSDGTLDTSFNAGNIATVSSVKSYPNAKYLVSTGNTLFKINSDGSNDNIFQSLTLRNSNLVYQSISAIAVQPDGSIIIGGEFSDIRGVPRSHLARLRANGSLDTDFFPVGTNGDVVTTIVNQSDDKIIIGGNFTMIENVIRLNVARLTLAPVRTPSTLFDFDGDGRADLAFYRPSNTSLYQLLSRDGSFKVAAFGASNDKLAFADYDGDGITDLGIFRAATNGTNNNGFFYILGSTTGFRDTQFGSPGDLPISGDWDGDGKADIAVYRGASSVGGQSYFYYRPSSIHGADFNTIPWGKLGDKPVMGDFDGDGKLDAAVYRPSNGVWYVLQSSNNQVIQKHFGAATDIPVPADYDGDGKTDLTVFRPSNGTWYIAQPAGTAAQNFAAVQFGILGDIPVAADYDGDGRADIAVYRPSSGTWYLLRSTAGFTGIQFGTAEDRPIPSIYIR